MTISLQNGDSSKAKTKCIIMIIFLLIPVFYYSYQPTFMQEIITQYSPDIYFGFLSVFFKFFMVYLSSKIPSYGKYSIYLRTGLIIWACSAILIFMNKLLLPRSLFIYYAFEFFRLTGMVIVCISGHNLIKKLGKMYFDANHNAMRDELTSLPNRRCFIRTLHTPVDTTLGLILIDIDYFKKINDQYGHTAGDKILQRFGNMLSNYTSERRLPARIGGEEFAVIIKGESSRVIDLCARKILREASEIMIDTEKTLSVSIGVGMAQKNESVESLFKRVDKALYKAKQAGRGKLVWSSIQNSPTSQV